MVGVGEEIVLEDNSAELFAEAQARAREQAAYEQLKASGMSNLCNFSQLPYIPWLRIFFSYSRELKYLNILRIQGLVLLKKKKEEKRFKFEKFVV